ncbi:NAD(P)/FAD-dependent oxidoreductase [Radicibacter daui]|uniref:NAD(P)/FAD-dependent oxidoreductase n=1 Tax=Radicibacter daui TaxID=3064829 RepID=UPI004046F621
MHDCDVAIIGAGPAGSVAAKFLTDAGLCVTVLEAQHFPRFMIGESLLPNSMNILERCGLLEAVSKAGFQFKTGAVFQRAEMRRSIDFRENFESAGWGTTFQVQRARFDALLAEEAAKAGARVRFGHKVEAARLREGDCHLSFVDEAGRAGQLSSRFVVDASGFGRVLPRLLDMPDASRLMPRRAIFGHFALQPGLPDFDRERILITVHPDRQDIWYWLIPFSDNSASVGVVFPEEDAAGAGSVGEAFGRLVAATDLARLLSGARPVRELSSLAGYASRAHELHGDGYVLLGNSAGFLDPIFSSGVTIALYSAELAARAIISRCRGEVVDWEAAYAGPLGQGVDTFRSYVSAWYDGRLQDIIFNQPEEDSPLKRMIVSILAGYAWNRENKLVAQTDRYLNMLYELCATTPA